MYGLSRQVPSLEHDSKIKGESLDLIKYIDSNFEGPALLPEVRLMYTFIHHQCNTWKKKYSSFLRNVKMLIFGCVDCQDPEKRQFADELIAYADAFTRALYSPLLSKGDVSDEAGKS